VGCPLAIDVRIGDQANQKVSVGEAIDVVVDVTNSRDEGLPMTVAVIGLPGGLEPVNESLDQLKESGDIDYYERRGREVVFYWRSFESQQERTLRFATVAQIGGRYAGPPSRTYLYYTAESKQWHEPLVVEIK
jgi:predicted alpha/beta-fold hydrolase